MSAPEEATAPESKENGEAAPAATDVPAGNYTSKQYGLLGLLMAFFGALAVVMGVVDPALSGNMGQGLMMVIWGISTLFIEIADMGEYLKLTYGPLRWCLCGMGKEKIKYDEIVDFGVTKTCMFGFGLGSYFTPVKLFNTCSYCYKGSCCGQTTIRLTIKERPQGLGAGDPDDCFCESCGLNGCCGESGRYVGAGCCCAPCCNPCGANCCMTNNVFVSTNEPDKLLALLKEKTMKDETAMI